VACPYVAYDIVFMPDLAATALSVPGLMVVNEKLLARPAEAGDQHSAMICAHEVAHLWFDGLVGPRWWDDVWLGEAIATYLSYAALAAIAGVSETLSWTGFAYTHKAETRRGLGCLAGHFPGGKTEIMRTVALAGFAELAVATQAAMGAKTGPRAVAAVADAYLDFAAAHPSLYEAMFQLPIDARFAKDDAETELRSGFNVLGAALGTDDDGTATELLWSALHGMSLLERAGRMRQEHRPNRIAELAARFAN
jgi:Peptidase family M1 domain/Tetracyclin repressor-like, C-terminal domain